MDSLAELALKGHFEELKKKFDRKGMVRAGADKPLLNIISKAVGMAEDIFEHDPEFFTDDHKEDYQSMIMTLQEYGYDYKGHPELMEAIEPKQGFSKMPMQKAGKKDQGEKSGNVKFGS